LRKLFALRPASVAGSRPALQACPSGRRPATVVYTVARASAQRDADLIWL